LVTRTASGGYQIDDAPGQKKNNKQKKSAVKLLEKHVREFNKQQSQTPAPNRGTAAGSAQGSIPSTRPQKRLIKRLVDHAGTVCSVSTVLPLLMQRLIIHTVIDPMQAGRSLIGGSCALQSRLAIPWSCS
jgi:hypothetical protein